jgi:hypothetical protein
VTNAHAPLQEQTTRFTADRLDALAKRSATLNMQRARVATLLEAEENKAQEAERQALELYGTADLSQLREMYAKQLAEFEQAWANFEVELDQFEANLVQAEKALRAA